MRVAYRVRQFANALVACVQPVQTAVLRRHLPPAGIELFLLQGPALQRHSLRVLRALGEQARRDALLIEAALLHDVGKSGGRIRLWHRVSKVLLDAVSPELNERLGSDDRDSWRYPFYVQVHHAALGATMIQEAGGDPAVAALVAEHHTPVEETARQGLDAERLVLLQRADAVV